MKADALKISDNIYWVGVLDWDIREYHGYSLHGTTYNSYLIFDEEKVALIDNVYPGKSAQFWARIKDAFEKEGRELKIDVVVQNHLEADHSGSLPEVIEKFPDVEVYCTAMAANGLKNYYPEIADFDFKVVNTGDEIKVGSRTLIAVGAAMLHWPDSMFVFDEESGILFTNDAFGQHICDSRRYDYEFPENFIIKESRRYYANLITLSSMMVVNKIEELGELGIAEKIKMIAPCHGAIWTEPQKILDKYLSWANGECKDKVTIVYDTMHYSTQKLAQALAEGAISAGFQVKSYYLKEDKRSDIVTDIIDSKAVFIGSPTIMNNPYPSLGDIVYYLNALSFDNTGSIKKVILFGSKGWGGGALRKLATDVESAGLEVVETIEIQNKPTEEILENAYEAAKKLALELKD